MFTQDTTIHYVIELNEALGRRAGRGRLEQRRVVLPGGEKSQAPFSVADPSILQKPGTGGVRKTYTYLRSTHV